MTPESHCAVGLPRPLLLADQTRTMARERAAETLLVWPVGAIEQHGPHLPVGTDTFTVEHVTLRAAEQAACAIPVTVAPTLSFGSSQHHLPFGGTMSLESETYYRVMTNLCESLIISGYRQIFLVNGHGGNHELLQLVARDLALKHQASLAAASYWTVAWDALVKLEAHVACRFPGHAGAFESSVMLALRPDLVREPRPSREYTQSTDPRGFVRPYRAEHPGAWQAIDGYSDSPARGDAERGRQFLTVIIDELSRAMIDFHSQAKSSTGR
ncbi:MAG: creatininase family protein [Planctomycetota bacterium]|nr:creatininase family protein [Planctomycetota bacterium]MDA1178540.1 creatininase family protein [Planctomycetota bacterium]